MADSLLPPWLDESCPRPLRHPPPLGPPCPPARLEMRVSSSYRKARAYVSYVTWARDFRYEPAMVVGTVAAARSAPGLMALPSVGLCCASVASPAAGSTTREPRLLSVAALRVIVAFAVCDYLLSSIRFSPVMSAGCSSPMMWRIEGATSARRPFLTVALLLSVT